MNRLIVVPAVAAVCAAAACVTINVYFPAASAERAADRIIDEVWGLPGAEEQPQTRPGTQAALPMRLLVASLEFIVPAAHAQQPDIDISSPEVQRIKASMEARFPTLKPHFDSGAVGLTADGLVAVRDPAAVPLALRNPVRALVTDENNDRGALYREIARANGQPQWEAQIRDVFSQRWIARAQKGWWVQDEGGNWKQR